tara:strand:+ start:412 stop:1410 length:999 start_codon:yes stop_codon:yes gene_type:complete
MGRFIGGIFGNTLAHNRTGNTGSGVYSIKEQYYLISEDAWFRPPFQATGGNQTGTNGVVGGALVPGNGYSYHFFTSPGNFVTQEPTNNLDYIVIGGGGAGRTVDGSYAGGAGGAGGYIEKLNQPLNTGTYAISIGAGGALDNNGSNSTAFGDTAQGGGHGGKGHPSPGNSGGSGGGGSGSSAGGAGFAYPGTSQQGHPGGAGGAPGGAGGGGGGAGASGGVWGGDGGGVGGDGKAAFSGDTGIPPAYGTPGPSSGRWFAGGGGGGTWSPGYGSRGGPPGAGGGGRGTWGGPSPTPGTDGQVNTGGGGGGAGNPIGGPGTAGGSGIVIIRYPT